MTFFCKRCHLYKQTLKISFQSIDSVDAVIRRWTSSDINVFFLNLFTVRETASVSSMQFIYLVSRDFVHIVDVHVSTSRQQNRRQ